MCTRVRITSSQATVEIPSQDKLMSMSQGVQRLIQAVPKSGPSSLICLRASSMLVGSHNIEIPGRRSLT